MANTASRKLGGGSSPYRPRVVVIEYNSNYGIDDFSTNPDDPAIFWEADSMFGASLSSLNLLATQIGYTLIYTDKAEVNAFFLRSDLPGKSELLGPSFGTQLERVTALRFRPYDPVRA